MHSSSCWFFILAQAERALAAAEVEKDELRERAQQAELQLQQESAASAKRAEKARTAQVC